MKICSNKEPSCSLVLYITHASEPSQKTFYIRNPSSGAALGESQRTVNLHRSDASFRLENSYMEEVDT